MLICLISSRGLTNALELSFRVLFPLFVDNSQRERNCKRQELSVKEHWCSRQDNQKLMMKVTL